MLKGLEALISLSLLLIEVSKISIGIHYLTVFFKLCQMYFLLLDSLILLEFILIGIGRSLLLLPIRRKGIVSFTEMCHPNMSGGKQRPIRQQGRCHHWPFQFCQNFQFVGTSNFHRNPKFHNNCFTHFVKLLFLKYIINVV